jgi:hypothetical protein
VSLVVESLLVVVESLLVVVVESLRLWHDFRLLLLLAARTHCTKRRQIGSWFLVFSPLKDERCGTWSKLIQFTITFGDERGERAMRYLVQSHSIHHHFRR